MLSFRILLIIVFLLIFLGLRFWNFYKDLPEYYHGQKISLIAEIADEPEIVFGRQNFNIRDGYGTRIRVVSASSPLLSYGDRVSIDGFFTKKLYKGKNYLVLYFPKIQTLGLDDNILTKWAIWTRNKAQNDYERHLPPVSSSLLLGILFGGKHGMPDVFSEHLRVAGVMHVIAASGMNVTFVAGALIGVLGSIFNRQFAIVIAGFGIVFYMFLAGFEASIVRAGIMALLAFGASLLGKQYLGMYSLLVAFYLMLIYSPGLLFDVGFQLSFLSTLGIVIFRPHFVPLSGTSRGRPHATENAKGSSLSNIPGMTILSEDIGTTIAAQIAALPVLMSVFGSVGILSILVNALVLWTIPILMAFGALSLVLGLVVEPIGLVFLYLCLPFLLFFEQVVSFFGGFGWVWKVEEFPWQLSIGYYLVLLAIVLYLRKKRL